MAPIADELAVVFYEELRRQAHSLMRGHENLTIQPTALVNEAYVKIANKHRDAFKDRLHFIRFASTTLRHVLIDHLRGKNASTRPGEASDLDLDTISIEFDDKAIDLMALGEILEEMKDSNPYGAKLIDLSFFGGATNEEMAKALDTPLRSVQRDLSNTKKLIYRRLMR